MGWLFRAQTKGIHWATSLSLCKIWACCSDHGKVSLIWVSVAKSMGYISKDRIDYAEVRNNFRISVFSTTKVYVSLKLHVHCGLVGSSALSHLSSGTQAEGESPSGSCSTAEKALGICALTIKNLGPEIIPTISHNSLNRTGYKIPLNHKGTRNRKRRTQSIAITPISEWLAEQQKLLVRKYTWIPWILSGRSVWAKVRPRLVARELQGTGFGICSMLDNISGFYPSSLKFKAGH